MNRSVITDLFVLTAVAVTSVNANPRVATWKIPTHLMHSIREFRGNGMMESQLMGSAQNRRLTYTDKIMADEL